MRSKQVLSEVQSADPQASIIDAQTQGAPAFKGTENVDLLCGKCGTVIGDGVSLATIGGRFKVDSELLVKCGKCRALLRLI